MPNTKITITARLSELKTVNPALYRAYFKEQTVDYYEPEWDTDLLEAVVDAIEHYGEKAVKSALRNKLKTDVMDSVRNPMIKQLKEEYTKVVMGADIQARLMAALKPEKQETENDDE